MLKAIKKMFSTSMAAMDIVSTVVNVALVVALIPVIKTFISSAENLTATETVILSLVTLFIVLALVVNIVKQSGLTHKE